MPRYTGPVIDAHQHFWEPSIHDYPWLRPGARIPFRYGDYESIKRRYLPPEYREDAQGQNVCASVYVEAEWNPSDPVGETRYVSGLATQFGLPNAIVAQAWLDRPDAGDVLAGQAGFPLVRGVRHKPGGPDAPGQAGLTLMSDDQWRRGYALLETHSLSFDLQTPWWNLAEGVALARDFPATVILLNHTGLPSDRTDAGLNAWHRAMASFAEQHNVRVKISGLGQPGRAWTTAENRWIVRETIATFGAERCMFGSNFPVDSLCASFATIFGGFRDIVEDLPLEDQKRLFYGTAREVYRINNLGSA
jgi:predicted TIM-barrel fold metal-dependent hydrolase